MKVQRNFFNTKSNGQRDTSEQLLQICRTMRMSEERRRQIRNKYKGKTDDIDGNILKLKQLKL